MQLHAIVTDFIRDFRVKLISSGFIHRPIEWLLL